LKTNNHFELQETWEIYHNYVRDFFKFPIVKRALWILWNEHCEIDDEEDRIDKNKILENCSDFTLDNPNHFTFLRTIFEDDENVRIFFQNLRENAIESWSIKDIAENYMSITQMILSMQYLVDVVEWPYGMESLLDERIKTIVEQNSYKTFASFEDSEMTMTQLWDYEKLLNLTSAWFSPISQYGDLVRSDDIARPYHIVHDAIIYWEEEWDTQPICIDKSWKMYQWIERIQAFITQYRCIIENVENIEKEVELWEVGEDYMQRALYTFGLQWTFPEKDDPDFIPAILEELSLILVDAKIQLKYFCEELGKTMKALWEDTKEYDPLKPMLQQEKERDFPTVWARITGVK